MLIQANPAGIQEVCLHRMAHRKSTGLTLYLRTQDFFWFCNAVVKWQTPSVELDDMFRKVCGSQEF